MGSPTKTKFCPECGDEYRAGFDTCADCHVALVDEPPVPDPGAGLVYDDPASHDLVAFDLSGATRDDRDALDLILNGRDIAHAWDGDLLVVAAGLSDATGDAIDFVTLGGDDADEPVDLFAPGPPPPFSRWSYGNGPAVLSRISAEIIDNIIGAVIVNSAIALAVKVEPGSALNTIRAGQWLVFGAALLMNAYLGWTPGKRVMRIRIRRAEEDRVPGLGRAVLRHAVRITPSWLVLIAQTAGIDSLQVLWLVPIGFLVVIAPAWGDPQRRMLHDRVARTIVVDR